MSRNKFKIPIVAATILGSDAMNSMFDSVIGRLPHYPDGHTRLERRLFCVYCGDKGATERDEPYASPTKVCDSCHSLKAVPSQKDSQ